MATRKYCCDILISLSVFVVVRAEVFNGELYFCVPEGVCPGAGGIDPRIITPDTSPLPPTSPTCPAGRFPCYAQGGMSSCGINTVALADGDAPVGAHQWQIYLENLQTGAFIGSGSLLSPYHVLTAAHKVLAFENNPGALGLYAGVIDPATRAQRPQSVAANIAIFNRTTYDNNTLKNDIAIVRLANPIPIAQNLVNTICIPPDTATATTYSTPPQRCVVSGYGQLQPTNPAVPTKLKQVFVTTTDIATCARGFAGQVDTNKYLDQTGGEICAGGEAQKDACFQDGGGPMVCGAGTAAARATVSGIVIWGKSCGRPGVYGVYTNVPPYRSWIFGQLAAAVP